MEESVVVIVFLCFLVAVPVPEGVRDTVLTHQIVTAYRAALSGGRSAGNAVVLPTHPRIPPRTRIVLGMPTGPRLQARVLSGLYHGSSIPPVILVQTLVKRV